MFEHMVVVVCLVEEHLRTEIDECLYSHTNRSVDIMSYTLVKNGAGCVVRVNSKCQAEPPGHKMPHL